MSLSPNRNEKAGSGARSSAQTSRPKSLNSANLTYQGVLRRNRIDIIVRVLKSSETAEMARSKPSDTGDLEKSGPDDIPAEALAKVLEHVQSAASLLETTDKSISKNQADPQAAESCWRAYVSLERAILHLKLTSHIEMPLAGPKSAPARNTYRRQSKMDVSEQLRRKLSGLEAQIAAPELRNPEALLALLRDCRDAAKFLVASYDLSSRRSTTS